MSASISPITPPAATTPAQAPDDMFQRIGELTRSLRNTLQQLGYDKKIEASLGAMPDAKARLSFIARLTGDAAEKVLNAVDAAQMQQDDLLAQALGVEMLLNIDPLGAVARGDLHHFIEQVKNNTTQTALQLSDIMLAQDFHDLTGQTVQKVVGMAKMLEDSLLKLLIETAPPGYLPRQDTAMWHGPVFDAEERSDVVSSQAQVDDLMESLGF